MIEHWGTWFAGVSLTDMLCILVAMALIRRSRSVGMWAYALMALPGTLAHELAHYLVALILCARPHFPSLRPIRTEQGWQLGSVRFRAGPVRALPIALAPLALAPVTLWYAGTYLHGAQLPYYPIHVWVVAAICMASLPSTADVRLALSALIVVAVIVAMVWLLR